MYGNLKANAIIEIFHKVLANLVHTYNKQKTDVDDADPWMVIISTAFVLVLSMRHITKEKSPGQIFFAQYKSLPINHVVDWRYINQYKQA